MISGVISRVSSGAGVCDLGVLSGCPNIAPEVIQALQEVGFIPGCLPELGVEGVWAPSCVLYEDRHFLLKYHVRKSLVWAVKSIALSGAHEVNLWIGRDDPYSLQRAQFLDHHIPPQVRQAVIHIHSVSGRDGLFLQTHSAAFLL